MASFQVKSHFTSIRLVRTMNIWCDPFLDNGNKENNFHKSESLANEFVCFHEQMRLLYITENMLMAYLFCFISQTSEKLFKLHRLK